MKILVVQLARLGDIYMSWPALRALRRKYPSSEIHLLTRPRFEGAVEGLTAFDRHISMSTSSILAPLIQQDPNIQMSLSVLNTFIDELHMEKYDYIINLTFSPASSYLVHALTHKHTKVVGYTRHNDGSLCLPDDMSSYFFAQVGIGKPNRVHLSDIFASMIDVDYIEEDWRAPVLKTENLNLPPNYLVVHVGASERHKTLSASSWSQILSYLFKNTDISFPVVLIGSAAEQSCAEEIIRSAPAVSFMNMVGKTKMSDLFSIIKNAEFLVGCDSAPIHMASLTDTPTFNISVGEVNFWETGPKATLSFIYRTTSESELVVSRVGEVLKMLLCGEVASDLIVRAGGVTSYSLEETPVQSFQWDLLKAIYLGGSYPLAEKMEILQAAQHLNEVNAFAMEQIEMIPRKGLEVVGPLLDRAEEVIENMTRWVPELSPLVNWYRAEKTCIGPGTIDEICTATLNVHERMARHLRPYIPHESFAIDEVENG
ncbi:MAG: glycosyltransferase family 9 protein [Pseudobdellovibrionaceae bacterium]